MVYEIKNCVSVDLPSLIFIHSGQVHFREESAQIRTRMG